MQSDLISKRALIKFIDKTVVPELLLHDNVSGAGVMAGLSKGLEEMDVFPTIDAVPVVRCFECVKRGDKCRCPMCYDESDGIDFYQVDNTDDDGFCHMGAKKDGGAEG